MRYDVILPDNTVLHVAVKTLDQAKRLAQHQVQYTGYPVVCVAQAGTHNVVWRTDDDA